METVTSPQCLGEPQASASPSLDMTMSLAKFLALPDELNVEILRYVLPTGVTFTVGSFNKKLSDIPGWEQPEDFYTYVLPLLIAGPAIKDIVYDTLFATNKISIWTFDDSCGYGVMYPPASINTYIRRIELRLQTDDAGLAFLGRFASGALGFPNLVEVSVDLDGNGAGQWHTVYEMQSGIPLVRKKLEAMAPIAVIAKKVTVSYEHADHPVYRGSVWTSRLPDTWEKVILNKIFLKNGTDEKTRWEQYGFEGARRGWVKKGDGKDWPVLDLDSRIATKSESTVSEQPAEFGDQYIVAARIQQPEDSSCHLHAGHCRVG
jgi:hypothetical protein